MPGLAGQVLLASCRRRSRGRPASMRTTSAASSPTRAARPPRAAPPARSSRGVARRAIRSMPASVATSTTVGRGARPNACSCRGPASQSSPAPRSEPRVTGGPISETIDALAVRSAISTRRPILYMRRSRSDRLERARLGVEPELLRRSAQDPHVGEDPALRVQHRRVAALARLEREDVVRDLALEELGRVGPAHVDLAALGALEQAGALAQRAVSARRAGGVGACGHRLRL